MSDQQRFQNNHYKYIEKKKLKEIVLKEVKEGMVTVSHQIENIQKDGNSLKKKEMEILKFKSTANKIRIYHRG